MELDIPGFGTLLLNHLVSDFTGTLSKDGELLPGVEDLLGALSTLMEIHVVTADSFNTAASELAGVECSLMILSGANIAEQKERYIESLGADGVIAIGNGNNDRLMLKAARLGIVVIEDEGCAVNTLVSADIAVKSIQDALRLLINPKRCIATLRL